MSADGSTADASSKNIASPAPSRKPNKEERDALVLLAGGDVNLGREVGQRLLADASYDPLDGVRRLLESADLRFVNLESPLSDQGGETESPYQPLVFTGPPSGAALLARAGIDVVSTANNHAWDYGRAGLLETMRHLAAANVAYAGTSAENWQAAYRPTTLVVRDFRVAVLAVTDVWNHGAFFEHPARNHVAWAVAANLRPYVEAARKNHDFVLVSYHGGDEYTDYPWPRTARLARRVATFGADAFIGHHPHVVQGVTRFGSMPAFYSLGNFVFRVNNDRAGTDVGLVARVTLRRGAEPRVELCPVVIEQSEPKLALGERKELGLAALQRVQALSERTGGVSFAAPDELGCALVRFSPAL